MYERQSYTIQCICKLSKSCSALTFCVCMCVYALANKAELMKSSVIYQTRTISISNEPNLYYYLLTTLKCSLQTTFYNSVQSNQSTKFLISTNNN